MKYLCIFFLILALPIKSQKIQNYSVNGISRKAIIYEPDKLSEKIPVVFVFHGHGGNANFASKRIDFQNYYKDALVIFMEGMPGRKVPGLDPRGKMNGWQIFPDDLEKRDLYFFDTVLKDIQNRYKTDKNKIFAVGHSNGARFVNVLWATRNDILAGIISVSAQGGEMILDAKPISVWMYMGKNDKLVPFDNQEKSVPIVKKNLSVNEKSAVIQGDKKIYPGANTTELIIQESEDGHEFPKNEIPEMVNFMKRNSKN